MPVRPDSRFAGLPLLRATAPDGGERVAVALRLRRREPPAERPPHLVTQDEDLDMLARRHLGSESLWWRILDANPVLHPGDLRPGDRLALPAPGPAVRATRARGF